MDGNKNMIIMMLSNQMAKYFKNEIYSPIIYMLFKLLTDIYETIL
jgi:hypothetical protein